MEAAGKGPTPPRPRAPRPPARAWTWQQRLQPCCCPWRSRQGEASRQPADREGRFSGLERGRQSFSCLCSSPPATPTHRPACRPRFGGSRSARCALAAPPAGWLCPAWSSRASPGPAARATKPARGPPRALGRRVCAGTAPPSRAARGWAFRPGRPSGSGDSRLRTPPLSRELPRGVTGAKRRRGVRKERTGPGTAGAGRRRGEVSGAGRGAGPRRARPRTERALSSWQRIPGPAGRNRNKKTRTSAQLSGGVRGARRGGARVAQRFSAPSPGTAWPAAALPEPLAPSGTRGEGAPLAPFALPTVAFLQGHPSLAFSLGNWRRQGEVGDASLASEAPQFVQGERGRRRGGSRSPFQEPSQVLGFVSPAEVKPRRQPILHIEGAQQVASPGLAAPCPGTRRERRPSNLLSPTGWTHTWRPEGSEDSYYQPFPTQTHKSKNSVYINSQETVIRPFQKYILFLCHLQGITCSHLSMLIINQAKQNKRIPHSLIFCLERSLRIQGHS